MTRAGSDRLRLLIAMCPEGRPVVDVGADHGHVAAALGGIATERQPNRTGRDDVRWVIADGLAPFRHVPVAIVAGMGAESIVAILTRGPRPDVAVLHADDDPPVLRRWLAAHGWHIEEERLAQQGHRFAEIIRAVPGQEDATGLFLEFGPRLLQGNDSLLEPHLRRCLQRFQVIADKTADVAEKSHQWAIERVEFLTGILR